MTQNEIEPPYAGGKMLSSWGASVARAVNAHEAELQSLRQPGRWTSARYEADGGTAIPGPFEPVYADGVLSGLTNCIYCAERQFVDCGTMSLTDVTDNTAGYVVLTITHPTTADTPYYGGTVAVEEVLPDNADDTVTKIPLYHITDGVVDIDLRAVPTGVLAR